MIPLLVIRHGKTQWNLEKRIQGRRDISLCSEGIAGLEGCRVPAEFQSFQWMSSPLKRAQETAALLGATHLHTEPAVLEMDWGEWDGQTIAELRQTYGEAMRVNEEKGLHMLPPGGESPAMVQKRLIPWLKTLTKPSIVVTHKGVIRALKSLAYDWDMSDKAPVPFDWTAAHLFQVQSDGTLKADRVNIPLEKP